MNATVKLSDVLTVPWPLQVEAATAYVWYPGPATHSDVQPEVSAEAAGAAARRSVPLLQVPVPLELELEEVLTGNKKACIRIVGYVPGVKGPRQAGITRPTAWVV